MKRLAARQACWMAVPTPPAACGGTWRRAVAVVLVLTLLGAVLAADGLKVSCCGVLA